MTQKNVWSYTKRSTVSKERKLIGSKWVFKCKKNGTHHARLVALGYSQVPGVDYMDNFAPVVNDVTLRVIMMLYLLYKYDSKIIDVETAFLYGDLEEQIYMKIPEGLQEYTQVPEDACVELNKSIYGLVQAARQWWKKLMQLLTEKLGFTCSKVDPCLLYRENKKGMVYMCLYVDDVLFIGNTEAIDAAVSEIKDTYSIKEIGKMYEYVGCTIIPDKEKLYLIQPNLIKKLIVTFGAEVEKLQKYSTPAAGGDCVVRPERIKTKSVR